LDVRIDDLEVAGSAAEIRSFVNHGTNTTFWKLVTASQALTGQACGGQAAALWSKHFAGRWRWTAPINFALYRLT